MATRKKTQAAEQAAPINEARAIAEALNPQETNVDKRTPEGAEQPAAETEQPAVEVTEQPTAETATKAETETAVKPKVEAPAEAGNEKTPEKPKTTQKKPVQTVKLNRLMNIRKAPDLNADIICTKRRDTVLPVIEVRKDGWLKVSMDGGEAYVLYESGKYGALIKG